MYTNQEVYDKIVNHLRSQGCKSEAIFGCAYFDKETGHKCAAGCLIPEDKYSTDLEGKTVNDDLVMSILLSLGYGQNLNLISELQHLHDDFRLEYWEEMFQKIAHRFDLQYSPPPFPANA